MKKSNNKTSIFLLPIDNHNFQKEEKNKNEENEDNLYTDNENIKENEVNPKKEKMRIDYFNTSTDNDSNISKNEPRNRPYVIYQNSAYTSTTNKNFSQNLNSYLPRTTPFDQSQNQYEKEEKISNFFEISQRNFHIPNFLLEEFETSQSAGNLNSHLKIKSTIYDNADDNLNIHNKKPKNTNESQKVNSIKNQENKILFNFKNENNEKFENNNNNYDKNFNENTKLSQFFTPDWKNILKSFSNMKFKFYKKKIFKMLSKNKSFSKKKININRIVYKRNDSISNNNNNNNENKNSNIINTNNFNKKNNNNNNNNSSRQYDMSFFNNNYNNNFYDLTALNSSELKYQNLNFFNKNNNSSNNNISLNGNGKNSSGNLGNFQLRNYNFPGGNINLGKTNEINYINNNNKCAKVNFRDNRPRINSENKVSLSYNYLNSTNNNNYN